MFTENDYYAKVMSDKFILRYLQINKKCHVCLQQQLLVIKSVWGALTQLSVGNKKDRYWTNFYF